MSDSNLIHSTMSNFNVDPSIIEHLITSQSGNVEDAIVELIQNSIDAGSTNIELFLLHQEISHSRRSLSYYLIDNGVGIPNRNGFVELLGTFGRPKNKERLDSNVFGTFAIGKGQIMKFMRIVWFILI